MKLQKLLSSVTYQCIINGTEQAAEIPEREITAVVYDSRQVEPGALFVCLKGFQSDGHAYIGKAIEAGAAAILVEDLPEKEQISAWVKEGGLP